LRTYIRIYVDDNPPKEYIFQPGSRPQWIAEKGFDILVGNAGGIEFDFNGERITDLGEIGKVIRISFPEGFESGIYGAEDG
jgi:cytoskeleton protein RodZ